MGTGQHHGSTIWRRARACTLVAAEPSSASLRYVSGTGAILATSAQVTIGETVALSHPEAGTIEAEVAAIRRDGIELAFASARGVAFALAAITADMSRPAAPRLA
jgi:hypothetical protein